MRERLAISVFVLAQFGCSSSQSTKPDGPSNLPKAELALTGGVVLSMDPALPATKPTAIALRGGRILKVGTDADIQAWIGPDTKVVKLEGRTAVPGLVDSHMHLLGLGMRRFGVDLVGTASIDEVKTRLKAAVATAEPGVWIQGRGWDQNDWESTKKSKSKFPTAKDLDDVAPNHPVVLERIDGHAIWVNSKAMDAAGINAKSKSKPGGEIIKVSPKASGVFVDNAMALITDKMPPLTGPQLASAVRLGQDECLSAGLTQVHDMGIDANTLRVLRELDQSGQLRLRVYGMLDGSAADLPALLKDGGPTIADEGKSRLTVRGVKFFADGALGSRGAALLKPYADEKKSSGLLVTQPEVLEAKIKSAHEAGYQVATHAIGDRANRITLEIYERVYGDKLKTARARIEHAQIVDTEDLHRFAKDGVIPSMQPKHATSDMPWAEKRVGKDRLDGAYAWKTLHSAGSTLAFGSDAPVEDVSPLVGLYAAVTRKDEFGSPEGGWLPEQTVTASVALAAYTRGAAWASFREKDVGILKEGFVADITVLDRDPLSIPPAELSGLQVMMTIIGGTIEYTRATTPAPSSTSTTTGPK